MAKNFARKTKNYYEAPPFYQRLFDLGVPEKYWYVHRKELQICQFEWEDEYEAKDYELSIEKQKKFVRKLLKAPRDASGVVAIGSNSTCDMALAMLFYFAKKYYEQGRKIKIWNMASGTRFFEIGEGDEDIDAIFLYNINAEDDPRRLQDVRDILFSTNGRMRFVAFAGDNPLRFFCERLRFYPNSYFYLMGKYKRILVEE